MRALIVGANGLERREAPEPSPASDEMLVRVEAFSLNRGELRLVEHAAEGTVPGWDVAGVVERPSADGLGLPEGSRVAGIVRSGAWAERVALSRRGAAEIPEGVSAEQAATLPIAGLTALRAVGIPGSLLGRRVLITGASGGVGRFAVQLAAAAGAEVVGVARPPRSAAVRALGALSCVESVAGAEGLYDLVLESVGGPSLAAAVDRVAPEGVVVVIGNSSEEETTFNARSLYKKSGARIHGILIFDEVDAGRIGSRELRHLLERVDRGTLAVEIGFSASWEELDDALDRLRSRNVEGKAVLCVD